MGRLRILPHSRIHTLFQLLTLPSRCNDPVASKLPTLSLAGVSWIPAECRETKRIGSLGAAGLVGAMLLCRRMEAQGKKLAPQPGSGLKRKQARAA